MKIPNPIFCVVFLLSGCLFHRPAYYPMQVLMRDGVPCFAFANQRKERVPLPEISSVAIFQETEEGKSLIWRRAFHPQVRIDNFSGECIAYGEEDGHESTFLTGLHYFVNMDAYIDGNIRRYQAYFCLYEGEDGAVEIHDAKWDYKRHERDWGMCETRAQ